MRKILGGENTTAKMWGSRNTDKHVVLEWTAANKLAIMNDTVDLPSKEEEVFCKLVAAGAGLDQETTN